MSNANTTHTTETTQSAQATDTSTTQHNNIQRFTIENPNPVELTNTATVSTITKLTVGDGMEIERGHPALTVRKRRNRKAFYLNFQIGDQTTPLSTFKEAMSIANGMRYRGWQPAMRKQPAGTYIVQRVS